MFRTKGKLTKSWSLTRFW